MWKRTNVCLPVICLIICSLISINIAIAQPTSPPPAAKDTTATADDDDDDKPIPELKAKGIDVEFEEPVKEVVAPKEPILKKIDLDRIGASAY